jgi:DNA-binding transcriptional LysR family regulator
MDTIDGMKTFVAVVETGSFTNAGIRLGISNKLVSKYIGQLEEKVGANLLHRTTRTMSLTESGEIYLHGCREVLATVEEMDLSLKTPSQSLVGRLRVTAPITFGETFITSASHAFLDLHPDLTLELELSDNYVDLAKGGFDLALRIGKLRDSSLLARKLGETELCVVGSPDYLDENGRPNAPQDLSNHKCILDTNNDPFDRWRFSDGKEHLSIPVNGQLRVNSATAACHMAKLSKGLILCPKIFIWKELSQGVLEQVLGGYSVLTTDIHAVYLPAAYRNPKVVTYVDYLTAELKTLLKYRG